jgi:carbonic anhydrase/acetyltransferase-like protein (isoleucine patch superfamily)
VIHPTAFVAPTAVVCVKSPSGQTRTSPLARFLVAQGNPIIIGTQSIIGENALIRATDRHPVQHRNYVRVGPNAALYGCTIEDEVFLATGVPIFQGARLGREAEVRINGVVHVKTILREKAMVPINWIAVGDPATILPPTEHEKIWSIQEPLNFPREAYGVERAPDGSVDMREITRGLAESASRHRDDRSI